MNRARWGLGGPRPEAEAWANIVAIHEVCRQIITCTGQLLVCSVAGNAGAGGVMLALVADRVVLRDGVVLNPHYRTMGPFGSEHWTYVLPRRVGEDTAWSLTTQCHPLGAAEAVGIGLADDYEARLARKRADRAADEQHRPLDDYRWAELEQMRGDIFEDRRGFAHGRRFISGRATRDSGRAAEAMLRPSSESVWVPLGPDLMPCGDAVPPGRRVLRRTMPCPPRWAEHDALPTVVGTA